MIDKRGERRKEEESGKKEGAVFKFRDGKPSRAAMRKID